MTKTFQAGAAYANITPPIGVPQAGYGARDQCSDTVDDELFGKALVLDDGDIEVALLTTDLIGLAPEFVTYLRSLIHAQTGIPPEHVLVCASHTHFGPALKRLDYLPDAVNSKFSESYVDNLARLLAGAVRWAHDTRQPAGVGWSIGQAPELVFNRRTKKADGKVKISWRMPPPEEAARLEFGPIDPEVGVLRVEGMNGQLIAGLINFACHPVCGVDRMYAISADYPGYAMRVVESIEGGICMFALGCAGNIVPIEREGRARQWIGRTLGAEALKILQMVSTAEHVRLYVANATVELPLKPLPGVEDAQRDVAETQWRAAESQIEPKSPEDITNPRGDLLRAEHRLRQAIESDGRSTVKTQIQIIRIGDLTMVGLPGEVFVEIGMAIKEAQAERNKANAKMQRYNSAETKPQLARPVFVLSLCNDSLAYVPVASAYEAGGYEVEWTKLGPGAGEILIETALELMLKSRIENATEDMKS